MKSLSTTLLFVLSTTLAFGQLETKIDSLFAEYHNSPGCAVGVYSKGEIIFKKGYGIANLDYDIKITPETVFDIGSVSKQFTAACIVLLENEGKLSLDDDIRKYIPEISEFDEGKITIRNLLHHTSGLRDYLGLMYLSGISFDDYFTEQMGLNILARQKELNFIPGSEHLYSNSGYLALAIIVRRVSGESIGTFAQKKIFDPLEMKNTFIYEDGAKVVKNRAIGYAKEGNDYKREHHFDFVAGGDGQVYTTVEDFFKWSENFKENNLGNSSFLNKMLTKGILSNGDSIDYALGLSHGVYKNLKTIGHGGAWGGFRAHYLQFPEEDLSIAIMSNLGNVNAEQKAKQIADIVLQDKFDNKLEEAEKKSSNIEIPKTIFSLTQIVGNYEIQPGVIVSLTIKNDSLNVFQTWNKKSFNVVKTCGNTFQIPGENDLSFTFSNLIEGHTQTLSILYGGRETKAERKKDVDVSGIELNNYSGSFYSQELNVNYNFKVEDGILKAKIENKQTVLDCTLIDMDEFATGFGLIRFQRIGGIISGFELDSGRIQNLKFEKK
ncbi:MAG: serine hydrolase domain-containing protein [Bacteroidales bacterium]